MATSDEDRERIYQKAALAQSVAPRGLADMLKLTPAGRRQVREQLRSRPRWQRVLSRMLYAWIAAWSVVLVIGLFSESGRLIVAWALALGVTMLALNVVIVVGSLRERR